MDINILQLAVFFVAGAGAGLLNALAGGGSFITVPLLMFTGLEPTVANATNRLGVWLQSFFGYRKYDKIGYFPKKYCLAVAIPTALGAIVGAYLATVIADDAFKKYFAFFMVLMTLVAFFKPTAKEMKEDVTLSGKSLIVNYFIYFGIGVYSGFVQAGVGFMMVAASIVVGLDIVRAQAVKLFLNLVAATVSLGIFIYAGKVLFLPGLVLGAGMALGAVTAVSISVKVSQKFLKRFVTLMIFAFAVLLIVMK